MSNTPALTLYYRSGCSLCEQMQEELFAVQPRYGFELGMYDVDCDTMLQSQFGHKVPVLCGPEDEEICHYFLDLQALEDYFSRA